MTENFLISIITPCLNRADMIAAAIESVLAQNHPHYEHIIVDGGSKDGTLDVLVNYSHLRVISEPDSGMYAALNKGLKLAKGDIIGFLNTDDLYPPGVFQAISDTFRDESAQAVAGKAKLTQESTDGRKETIAIFSPSQKDQLIRQMILGIPAFNAWFFQKKVVQKLFGFNEEYKIIADREFMIRFAFARIPYVILDRDTYEYRQHRGSMTIRKGDANESRVIPEHLQMTKCLLVNTEISEEARRLLIQMRTRDTMNLASYNFRKRHYSLLGDNLMEGLRFDKAWPGKFLLRIIRRIFRRRGETNANR